MRPPIREPERPGSGNGFEVVAGAVLDRPHVERRDVEEQIEVGLARKQADREK